MHTQKKHIVIVGAGFGGLRLAELLTKKSNYKVTLVSEREDFWYYPSLYRTATGASDELSRVAIKPLFEDREIAIVIDKAVKVDKASRTLTLQSKKQLSYDQIVFGLGVVTNYFGIKGLAEYSYGVKSIEEAEELKHHIHSQLIEENRPDARYVVVGGGPTGIELAAQLPSYIKHVMRCHGVAERKVHIDLVEGAPHLLPRMKPQVGRAVERQLRRLGITLHLHKAVEGELVDELMVSGKPLKSHTVIWTAGQANNPFFTENDFTLTEHKKVAVNEYLEAENDIFVIGDNAETQYSGMAQTALYDAEYLFKNFERERTGRNLLKYVPKKPVYVIPAGPHWAAVEWGSVNLYGRLGWLLREAGDIKGFLEIESPLKAGRQWVREFQSDHECTTCS